MPVWQRVLAYGAALGLVLAAAIGIGRLVGPFKADDDPPAHADEHLTGTDDMTGSDHETGHGDEHSSEEPTQTAPPAHAYQISVTDSILEAGHSDLAFTIFDETGAPLTSYDLQHTKPLHLVLVSNDLARYRHVHPELDKKSGVWSVPVTLEPGPWTVYADFVPRGGEETVLSSSVSVAGDYHPVDLGGDRSTDRVDGYQVNLAQDGATLVLHVTRGGKDVTDLEPYLGAYGHLVAISTADFSFLHVHPEDGAPGPEVAFQADFPAPGPYRLFLDFKHGGQVHTADFTITVDDVPSDDGTDGHDH